jgi:hypothetical protein
MPSRWQDNHFGFFVLGSAIRLHESIAESRSLSIDPIKDM